MLTGGANDLGTQNDHGLSISRAERNATFRVSRSRGNLADHFVGGQINPVQRVFPHSWFPFSNRIPDASIVLRPGDVIGSMSIRTQLKVPQTTTSTQRPQRNWDKRSTMRSRWRLLVKAQHQLPFLLSVAPTGVDADRHRPRYARELTPTHAHTSVQPEGPPGCRLRSSEETLMRQGGYRTL